LIPCSIDGPIVCAYYSVIGGSAGVKAKSEISGGYGDGISGPRVTVLIDAEERYFAFAVVVVDLHDGAERLGAWKRSKPVADEILALHCARRQ